MLLFKKRKDSDDMRPLTEEEIQKKLYGSYKRVNAQGVREGQDVVFPEEMEMSGERGTDTEQPRTEKDLFTFADGKTVEEEETLQDERGIIEEAEEVETETAEVEEAEETEETEETEAEEAEKASEAEDVAGEEPAHEGFEASEEIVMGGHAGEEEKGASMDSIELEEQIWEENKPNETVTFTLSEKETPSSASIEATGKEETALHDFIVSFKIDVAEFIEKIRHIKSGIIIGIIIALVLLIIGFNIWSQTSRDTVAPPDPAAIVSRPRAQQVRSEETRVITTTSVDEEAATISDIPVTEPTGEVESIMGTTEEPLAPPFYTMQICVYEDINRAQNLSAELESAGKEAFYQKFTTRSGRQLYAVYIGRYPTSEAGISAFRKFKESEEFSKFPDSFVKWLK